MVKGRIDMTGMTSMTDTTDLTDRIDERTKQEVTRLDTMEVTKSLARNNIQDVTDIGLSHINQN